MTSQRLDEARQLLRQGRVQEALELYRGITDAGAVEAEPWKLRAVAEHQLRRLDEARRSIGRALEISPADASQHLLAAHIAEDAGDPADAARRYRAALEARPDWVPALNGLGALLLAGGRAEEALACFQKAVQADGKAVRAWNNLGLAHIALERYPEAIRVLDFAVSLEPGYALAHLNLARAHDAAGDIDRALASLAAALQAEPRLVDAHLLRGDLLRRRGDREGARRSYLAASAAAPKALQPATALGNLLWEEGLAGEARRAFEAAHANHPGSFKAALGANLVLPLLHDSSEAVLEARAGYEAGLERLMAEAEAGRFRFASAAAALADVKWTNFYLAYQGGNDREPQRRYGQVVRRVLEPVVPQWLEPPPRRTSRDGRLRVGFLSFFFFNCTAGRYFASWIHDLDPKRFERFVYYTNPWVADDTRAIAASAEHFRHLPNRPLHAIAAQVLADELDVLVYPELGMHADTFGLAHLNLAPVQVAGWGHPTTTGLPSIDWFLSSEAMEPEGAEALYTERLATLPGLGTRYALPSGAETGTRSDFGLPEDAHLYLVPQSLFKIHPDNDALIASILQRDPRGKVVLFAASHASVTNRFATRLERSLRKVGTSVSERVIFLPFMTHAAYLGLNRVCDVMIDTLHWSGGNTSLDALAMGLPIVTLPGACMRGRQSMAMLRIAGLPELVAADMEDLAAKAVEVATDRDSRAELSRRIEEGRGALFDRQEPIRALESFLERAARSGPGA